MTSRAQPAAVSLALLIGLTLLTPTLALADDGVPEATPAVRPTAPVPARQRYRRPALVDPAMWVALRLPLTAQAAALLLLDTALPAGALLPSALLGAALGAVAAVQGQEQRLRPSPPTPERAGTMVAGGAVGAAVGMGVGMFLSDLVISPFHLGHLGLSRILVLTLLGPPVVSALGWWALLTAFPPPAGGLRILALVAGAVPLVALICLVPFISVVPLVAGRWLADRRRGSPLWEATGGE